MSIQSGFTVRKEHIGTLVKNIDIINPNITIHTMRPLQEIIFGYKYIQYFILSTPPGAGKSASIKFPVALLLEKNPKLKVVIAVPNLVLIKSFGDIILQYLDGKQRSWQIDVNLCETTNCSKVEELNDFLNRRTNLFSRVAVTTHRTLALMNQGYPDNQYSDVMFIIDEAHHVLYPELDKDEEGAEVVGDTANKLGGLIRSIFDQKNDTVKIWFLTATFYRGDKFSIIPPEMMDIVTKYHLSLDEYWKKYIKHIETFEYNFVIYKERDVFTEIKEIFKTKGKRKTIIYCPYKGYLLNGSTKLQFRDKIISAIREVWSDCRIIDLVQLEGRDGIKDIIIDNKVEFDVVLAVKLFDEGTDWEQAESIIDLAPSNSLRVQVQRFGRLLRDIPGKSHIDYNAFFPYHADFKNDEERRTHMSKCFNAFAASCLLHDAIEPVECPRMPRIKKEGDEEEQSSDKDVKRENPFIAAVPDDSLRQSIIENVSIELQKFKRDNPNPTKQEVKECMIDTLKSFGINDYSGDIVTHITKMIRRAIQPKNPEWMEQTVDVSWMIEAGFDKVWTDDIFDELLSFTTGICGVSTFKEFRSIYDNRRTVEEAVKVAEELASKNGGKLYSSSKLKKMGYIWLLVSLYKYPEKFSHINRTKLKRTLEEAVKVADDLAEENGGELYSYTELKEKGFNWIVQSMIRYPEKFSHIKQEKLKKDINEAVKTAENLAQENGGKLYSYTELMKKNFIWIVSAMRVYPEKFSHIKQEKSRSLLEDTIKAAENLAKENGGVLYSYTKLKEMGYSWLILSVQRYPEEFSHIKREILNSENKDINEAVKTAETLAKENGGKLYAKKVLKDMGLIWLISAMDRNPKKFSHIKQIKLLRPIELVIKTAEDLSKENGGKLYSNKVLKEKGYTWIISAMYKHPDLFAHIKRSYARNFKRIPDAPLQTT